MWSLPLPPPPPLSTTRGAEHTQAQRRENRVYYTCFMNGRARKNQFPFLPAFTRFVRTAESCPLAFSLDSHGLREFNWILPASYIFLHFSLSLSFFSSFLWRVSRDVYLFYFFRRIDNIDQRSSIRFFFFFFLERINHTESRIKDSIRGERYSIRVVHVPFHLFVHVRMLTRFGDKVFSGQKHGFSAASSRISPFHGRFVHRVGEEGEEGDLEREVSTRRLFKSHLLTISHLYPNILRSWKPILDVVNRCRTDKFLSFLPFFLLFYQKFSKEESLVTYSLLLRGQF